MLSGIKIKTPLRVSWDISGLSELNQETIELFPKVKGKFLFEFNLIIAEILLRQGGQELWETYHKSLPETTLTVVNVTDSKSSELINGYPFHLVIVDWSALNKAALDFFAALKGNKAVRFVLKGSNLSLLENLVERCRDLKVTTLIFANPPLLNGGSAAEYMIEPEVLRAESGKLNTRLKALSKSCKIQVHDLFCEEFLLGKGQREGNFAGCQAGLYLAHVDARGTVYGCASLPLAIGELGESDWEEIWQSEKRFTLRSQIESEACLCHKCLVFNSCKGGCRGLSWVKHGNFERPDIFCQIKEL
jgi:GeoRSP system SPASM domain protein